MNVLGEARDVGLVTGIRVFALLALGIPALWSQDLTMVFGLIALAGVWTATTLLVLVRAPLVLITAIDAIVVGAVCALSLTSGHHLLMALALPPFIAGLWRGTQGVLEALALEAITIAVIDVTAGLPLGAEEVSAIFSWVVSGLGFGFVAAFFRSRVGPQTDAETPYREARHLLRNLVEISGHLSGGLDPAAIAGEVIDHFTAAVPMRHVTVHVHRGGSDLVPLATQSSEPDIDTGASDALAQRAWSERRLVQDGHVVAMPLMVSGSPVAVLSGAMAPGVDAHDPSLPEALRSLTRQLDGAAIRLDTASLFAEFRDRATSDERRRLAREMHDGVAQDIASMGYLIDIMAATAPDEMSDSLRQLREMVTSVVGEVRRSVMTLRTEAAESESLGAAIASLARHLSDVSGIPIQVTVDERTHRLRHEVEAELLRIAQEAMNNAVKHARASVIDVHCRVAAPAADITVSDDGRGLGPRRRDSHGLTIMRERAALVGADLDISRSPSGGTTVRVSLQPGAQSVAVTGSSPLDLPESDAS